MLVRKSIKQRMTIAKPDDASMIQRLMESFRAMCNDAIRIGLAADASSPKRLSNLTYTSLKEYGVPSYYKLCAISKAAGILAARKKSIKRGFTTTRRPYLSRPLLVSCYGFKIDVDDGVLLIPLGDRNFARITLNAHTREIISLPGVKVRSFTMTEDALSLRISKEVEEMEVDEPTSTVGIDRNLRNIAAGNQEKVTLYDTSKVVEIGENTRSIVRSFKRNDVRVRRKLLSKYGQRCSNRIKQILNHISKDVVAQAKADKQVIVFEDITGIRKLYRKGNGQGRDYRASMNSVPWYELKRQVEYKAAWEGVPVIILTKGETRGTTMDCPKCGEKLQSAGRGDVEYRRQLWCDVCEVWRDRDLCAVLNISRRGWMRFVQSKGGAGEAVKGNPKSEAAPKEPVILRVDASKLCHAHEIQ